MKFNKGMKKNLEKYFASLSQEEIDAIGLKLKNSSPSQQLIFIGELLEKGE
jgi:hypothetical protein